MYYTLFYLADIDFHVSLRCKPTQKSTSATASLPTNNKPERRRSNRGVLWVISKMTERQQSDEPWPMHVPDSTWCLVLRDEVSLYRPNDVLTLLHVHVFRHFCCFDEKHSKSEENVRAAYRPLSTFTHAKLVTFSRLFNKCIYGRWHLLK